MQLSPPSRHSIPLWSKYSPQHPVLKHPQFMFLPYCQRPCFYWIWLHSVMRVMWFSEERVIIFLNRIKLYWFMQCGRSIYMRGRKWICKYSGEDRASQNAHVTKSLAARSKWGQVGLLLGVSLTVRSKVCQDATVGRCSHVISASRYNTTRGSYWPALSCQSRTTDFSALPQLPEQLRGPSDPIAIGRLTSAPWRDRDVQPTTCFHLAPKISTCSATVYNFMTWRMPSPRRSRGVALVEPTYGWTYSFHYQREKNQRARNVSSN
jgi:hypothetical protein